MIKVYEMMTRKVVALETIATVADACDVMADGDFRHLPIVNRFNKLVGVVSHRDILRCGVSHLIHNHAERQAMLDRKMLVKDIMTSPVKAVHPRDSLRSCGLLMQRFRYGCLPVVENELLVGIITDTDFVRIAVHLIEAQEAIDELGPVDCHSSEDDDVVVQISSASFSRSDNMH